MKKEELKLKNLANIIESILFVSGNAVSVQDIAEKLNLSEKDILKEAEILKEKYSNDSGINLLIFNKKLQFSSNPKYAEDVSSVLNPIKERELSKSMLEVAAIIAYKQPVSRVDLEDLRGKNSEFAIQNLLKMGVIEIVGRKDTVGKPVLFGTTDAFLKRFQISSLDELPDYNELMDKIALLRSPSNDSNYLFEKDTYVEGDEVSQSIITDFVKQSVENPNTNFSQNENFKEIEDFEFTDIEDEELPDYLKDEDVQIFK